MTATHQRPPRAYYPQPQRALMEVGALGRVVVRLIQELRVERGQVYGLLMDISQLSMHLEECHRGELVGCW